MLKRLVVSHKRKIESFFNGLALIGHVRRTLIDILLEKATNCSQNIYVSDVRYDNELEALQKADFICIKLLRNTGDKDRVGTGNLNHQSENSISDEYWDIVIDNNGTLDELYTKIENVLLKYHH